MPNPQPQTALAPNPSSGFLAIQPHVQPVLTFAHQSDATLFHGRCPNSHVSQHNKTWVYLPLPAGLRNSHYTIANKGFTFEFDSQHHAKAFNEYILGKGHLKIHEDSGNPSQNYFRVSVKRH